MKLQIKHYGRIENGKKLYYNQPLYNHQIQALEGKQFVEIIQEVHKKPSQNSYNYYRGAILPTCYQSEMFNHLDNKDDIHTLYFAPKFLSYKKLANIGGQQKEVTITRSLADLNQEEMTDFINRVKADCEMNQIFIPDSSEYYNKLYQK